MSKTRPNENVRILSKWDLKEAVYRGVHASRCNPIKKPERKLRKCPACQKMAWIKDEKGKAHCTACGFSADYMNDNFTRVTKSSLDSERKLE